LFSCGFALRPGARFHAVQIIEDIPAILGVGNVKLNLEWNKKQVKAKGGMKNLVRFGCIAIFTFVADVLTSIGKVFLELTHGHHFQFEVAKFENAGTLHQYQVTWLTLIGVKGNANSCLWSSSGGICTKQQYDKD
jgi:hypothetical protein